MQRCTISWSINVSNVEGDSNGVSTLRNTFLSSSLRALNKSKKLILRLVFRLVLSYVLKLLLKSNILSSNVIWRLSLLKTAAFSTAPYASVAFNLYYRLHFIHFWQHSITIWIICIKTNIRFLIVFVWCKINHTWIWRQRACSIS